MPKIPEMSRAPHRERPAGVSRLFADDPAYIGPYRLLGRLGSGGMGTVYLAVAPGGSFVAAKVVHPQLASDDHFRARFATEARLASRVASFSTAPVLDHGQADGRPYLITEYIEGVSLDRMVRDRGPLSPSMVQGVAVSIAAALTSIHNAGLVHRDLKPGNVILSLSGARVIDFGIARALDAPSSLTRSGVTMGSPGWMAPEQILGKPLTSAADVFAWGCMVAYAATGRHPYGGGDPVSVAYRTLHEGPNLYGVPEQLYPVVAAALSRRPERRPGARDVLTRLSGSTATQPSGSASPAGDTTRLAAVRTPLHHFPVRHRVRRRPLRWAVTGCVLLLTVTALLLLGMAYPTGIGDSGGTPPRDPGEAPRQQPADGPAQRGRQAGGDTASSATANRMAPGASTTPSRMPAAPPSDAEPTRGDPTRTTPPGEPSPTPSPTGSTRPPAPTPTDPTDPGDPGDSERTVRRAADTAVS